MIRTYLAEPSESISYLTSASLTVGDKALSRGKLRGVTTLGDRIDWILEHCRAPSGDKWNAKSLSLASGLSETHVGQFKRGTVKRGQGETLAKIAVTAGVSAEWLITGKGEPIEETRIEYDVGELYPNLVAEVAFLLEQKEISPPTGRKGLTTKLSSKVDPPRAWWREQLLALEKRERWEAEHPDEAAAKRATNRARQAADDDVENARRMKMLEEDGHAPPPSRRGKP